MLRQYWPAFPFLLQMLCMAADEFWFHRKRGLPRWERIGHPLDTLTVVVCLVWMLSVEPGTLTRGVYIALAVFSCLFVTKDEPVHRRYCSAAEQWLHAILFLLHPVVLAGAAFLWLERPFLALICGLMVGFAVYQFIFWNIVWPRNKSPFR